MTDNTDSLSDPLYDDSWNEDILTDLRPKNLNSLVVYSRDWTVDTIVSQIRQGHIDLNPKFQRRNAWKDDKRSRLIESLIIGIPVPEIVLAEHPKQKKSFIIIDGKQRLLTVAGFISPDKVQYWKKPVLSSLTVRKDLNRLSYKDITANGMYADDARSFQNSDIRCTVISNYTSNDVLYDIFYRLNTGSVPLSTQELRQVLNKGDFADYLMSITNTPQPVHNVLRLNQPDPRLKDIEIIFRFIAFCLFGENYRGNLKNFLDESMRRITEDWDMYKDEVEELYKKFNHSITTLERVMGATHIGRKFTGNKWETSFNKVLFEVEVYYIMFLSKTEVIKNKQKLLADFKQFCSKNTDFRLSIEAGTNNLEPYQNRYRLFRDFINRVFKTNIKDTAVSLQKVTK
jgi:hypothetical protein